MIIVSKKLLLSFSLIFFVFKGVFSQQDIDYQKNKREFNKLTFFNYRALNVGEVSSGVVTINGDFKNPLFQPYFRIGYKRFITKSINIGVTYNKFNIAYENLFNKGYMSFDANLEFLFSPLKRFSPFIYLGSGYNAANYFESTSIKAQGAVGFEYIIFDGVGMRIFGEYNHNFDDKLDGLVSGESNDVLYRVGIGFNLYFGGNKQKEKRLKNIKTVIKSNPILPNS